MEKKASGSKAIREYMSVPGKPVTVKELKELSPEERAELAKLVCEALDALVEENLADMESAA